MLNFQLEPLKVVLLQCYSYSTQLQHNTAETQQFYLPFPSTLRSSHSPDPELDDCFLDISGCQERQDPGAGRPFQLSVSSFVVIYHT